MCTFFSSEGVHAGRIPLPPYCKRSAKGNPVLQPSGAQAQGPTCELRPHKLSHIELWNGSKRLQTLVADVADNTITIRSLDWDRDRFDIEFALQEGTTYNRWVAWVGGLTG